MTSRTENKAWGGDGVTPAVMLLKTSWDIFKYVTSLSEGNMSDEGKTRHQNRDTNSLFLCFCVGFFFLPPVKTGKWVTGGLTLQLRPRFQATQSSRTYEPRASSAQIAAKLRPPFVRRRQRDANKRQRRSSALGARRRCLPKAASVQKWALTAPDNYLLTPNDCHPAKPPPPKKNLLRSGRPRGKKEKTPPTQCTRFLL